MTTANEMPMAVAAGHPATVAAAVEILDRGGNAFDAVIAAGLTATVAEPALTSLAGGGFLTAGPTGAPVEVIDFFVNTPGLGVDQHNDPVFDEVHVEFESAVQSFHCGPASIAVPGVLDGYVAIHERFGRLDRSEIVAPAVRCAREGLRLGAVQASILALLEPILRRNEACERLFAPRGPLLRAGEHFSNPDLASFLEDLGSGVVNGFAQRELKEATLRAASRGGMLTAADLEQYRVEWRSPQIAHFGGRMVYTNPPPSFGGALLGAAFDRLAGHAFDADHPQWIAHVAEVMAAVESGRELLVRESEPLASRLNQRGTTHISVADGEGNVASMTTSNGECSGEVIPGTGILTNNIMGEDDLHPDGFHASPAGQRVGSMMAPAVVTGADGDVALVFGSGGSKRIRSALLQVALRHLVHGSSLNASVDAPRVHWNDDVIEVEPGFSPAELAALREVAPLNCWDTTSLYFGGVHAVDPRSMEAAGDPRRDGAAHARQRR